jgi:hypothetical protein
MKVLRSAAVGAVALVASLAAITLPTAAEARGFVSIGIGVPFVAPVPVYPAVPVYAPAPYPAYAPVPYPAYAPAYYGASVVVAPGWWGWHRGWHR